MGVRLSSLRYYKLKKHMNLKKLEFKVEIHHFNPGAKKHPPSEPVFLKSATQTRHGFLRFGIVGSAISFLYRILSITFFFHLDISQLTLRWQLHGNLGLQKLFADILHNRCS